MLQIPIIMSAIGLFYYWQSGSFLFGSGAIAVGALYALYWVVRQRTYPMRPELALWGYDRREIGIEGTIALIASGGIVCVIWILFFLR